MYYFSSKILSNFLLKKEIRVLWGDYFKTPHFDTFPEIHDLSHGIMQKASACKQGIQRKDGEELVNLVNRFAEIFWETKGREVPWITAG